jgi:hypothetical protein
MSAVGNFKATILVRQFIPMLVYPRAESFDVKYVNVFTKSRRYAVTILCVCVCVCVCDYRRGMDWILDLLTTCIHNSELQFTEH